MHVCTVHWDILALQFKQTDALSVTAEVCLSTGRSEFVQKLKLEATLNVHDGCVSTTIFDMFLIDEFISNLSICFYSLGKENVQFYARESEREGH